jgi:hypothetical protein
MRKYRVGDCIGYTSIDTGCSEFTIIEEIITEMGVQKKLKGRWFFWDQDLTYLYPRSVESYIPSEYC